MCFTKGSRCGQRYRRRAGSTLSLMSAFDESQLPVTLRPLARAAAASRFGSLFIGVLGLAILAGGIFGGLPTAAAVALVVVGALGVALALLLAARTGRVAVTLTADELVIGGRFSTRAIPRAAIVEITDEPRLLWRDGQQRGRRTWLTGLSLYRDQGRTGGMNTQMRTDLQAKLALVRAWAGEPASGTMDPSTR